MLADLVREARRRGWIQEPQRSNLYDYLFAIAA
jgi:hypothetical protein